MGMTLKTECFIDLGTVVCLSHCCNQLSTIRAKAFLVSNLRKHGKPFCEQFSGRHSYGSHLTFGRSGDMVSSVFQAVGLCQMSTLG